MSLDPVYHEAIDSLTDVFQRANKLGLREPTAMSVATADAEGRPSVRIVLMRHFDARGIVFFTNAHSRKGRELAVNPFASACFHWEGLGEQVRVDGPTRPVPAEESDRYWESRRRASQIGAWASEQSAELSSRERLERRVAEYEEKFGAGPVPRPEHWYGYRIEPIRIEIWRDRPARLHERTFYELREGQWTRRLLFP